MDSGVVTPYSINVPNIPHHNNKIFNPTIFLHYGNVHVLDNKNLILRAPTKKTPVHMVLENLQVGVVAWQ